jgi:hypothetical protein
MSACEGRLCDTDDRQRISIQPNGLADGFSRLSGPPSLGEAVAHNRHSGVVTTEDSACKRLHLQRLEEVRRHKLEAHRLSWRLTFGKLSPSRPRQSSSMDSLRQGSSHPFIERL